MNVLVTLALEGWLEEAFIPAYLQCVFKSHGLEILRDSVQIPQMNRKGGKHTNLKTIHKSVAEHISGLREHPGPGLFVFGVDCEDNYNGRSFIEDADFQSEVNRIKSVFADSVSYLKSSHGICFVPVICMETWIWYLRNPEIEAGSIDRLLPYDLKGLVFAETEAFKKYGKRESSMENSRKVIKDLIEQQKMNVTSFQCLAAQSPSFQEFHQQVEAFVASVIK